MKGPWSIIVSNITMSMSVTAIFEASLGRGRREGRWVDVLWTSGRVLMGGGGGRGSPYRCRNFVQVCLLKC